MKQLLITIAAVVLVGCGVKPNYSGVYTLDIIRLGTLVLELKPDSSFIGTPQGEENNRGIGTWKVEGDLLVCEGTTEKSSKIIVLKLNKTTLELTSMTVNGEDRRPPVPEGADGNFFKKSAPSTGADVAEAAKVEPSTAKAPNISIDDAARRGNIEAVKQHLAAGTDVNLKYKGGTPLHQAARLNKNEIVKLLISSGADIHVTDDVRGRTPLHFASNSEIAEMLIVAGADVNAKARGSTPLHNAAYRGLKEIVELLIAKGANINPKNNQGKTALDEAIKKSHEKIADLLRKHGGKTAEELKAEGK